MRWTGVIVGLFLVFHLLDLTWGTGQPATSCAATSYDNVVHSFQRVPVAIVYIVANLALGVHIFHGAWSCSRASGSTTRGSTVAARSSPSASPLIIVHRQRLLPARWSSTGVGDHELQHRRPRRARLHDPRPGPIAARSGTTTSST